MGVTNFLVDGVSGAGKSSVCRELRRRGFRAVDGDTDLAYQGDPETGAPTDGFTHEHHIWSEEQVRRLVADQRDRSTFFCGGSRNHRRYLDVFDAVFVLEIDADTLERRLGLRDPEEFGGTEEQRALVRRLHRTKEDTPDGLMIDATRPLIEVVDEIVRRSGVVPPPPPASQHG